MCAWNTGIALLVFFILYSSNSISQDPPDPRNPHIQIEFTRHDNPDGSNTFGLSFTQQNKLYYLVPNTSQMRIGWSTNIQYPFKENDPQTIPFVPLYAYTRKCPCCVLL